MEKYSDVLHRLANMLDEDFSGNREVVLDELISIGVSLSAEIKTKKRFEQEMKDRQKEPS